MQGWMIALIVVSSVILCVTVTYFVVAFVSVEKILGRKFKVRKGDTAEAYGVDIPWFDTVKDYISEQHITAFDGIDLGAMCLKHGTTEGDAPVKKVAIVQHGFHASPRSVQPYAKMFWNSGFDVYMPAARGHDISGGKLVGMAWIDRFDVMRWIDKVIAEYGDKVEIALMGISMGGATVAAVSGMNPPPQVKCIIDDCGFSSQRAEYEACLPGKLPKSLILAPFIFGVKVRQGYSVNEADIGELVHNATLPMLFIHGERDAFVPCALGKKLYDECASPEKHFEVFDAVHASSFVVDRVRYATLFAEFVKKHIPSAETDGLADIAAAELAELKAAAEAKAAAEKAAAEQKEAAEKAAAEQKAADEQKAAAEQKAADEQDATPQTEEQTDTDVKPDEQASENTEVDAPTPSDDAPVTDTAAAGASEEPPVAADEPTAQEQAPNTDLDD